MPWLKKCLAALLLAAGSMTVGWAAEYPAGPVKIVHPYPGGLVDVGARALAELLAARWKQPVLVENRPGANELLAGDAVAKSAKDGLTLLVATEATFAHNLFLYAKLPFDPLAELQPVSELFEIRFGLITRGNLPVASLKDFVELMRRDGARHSYASSGPGGPLHLAMEGLRRSAGFEMLHVPYKTLAQVAQDLLGGRVDAVFASVPFALPFLPSGRLKLLAVTGSSRMKLAPDVPTFAELGLGGVDDKTSIVLALPRGTPADVVRKLHADVKETLLSREYAERFLAPNGLEAVGSDPQLAADALAARRAVVQRLIKALDIKVE